MKRAWHRVLESIVGTAFLLEMFLFLHLRLRDHGPFTANDVGILTLFALVGIGLGFRDRLTPIAKALANVVRRKDDDVDVQ